MWVGTNNGVIKIHLENDYIDFKNLKISHYKNQNYNPNSLDNNNVNVILKDKDNNIWVGTNGHYLNKYNPKTNNFERVLIENKIHYELNHLPKKVYVDENGNFWIGNDLSNLIFWNKKDNTFNHISLVDKQIPIYDIYKDDKGFIWVSTDGFGLYVFNKKFKKLIKHIVNSPSDPFSLPNNQPSKIFQDKNGIFWIGSYNKGVSKLNTSKNVFGHYYYQPNNPEGINGEIVQSVLQDSKQNLWLGVYNTGLNLFNEEKQIFKHYVHDSKDENSLSSNKILYMFESSDGYIWICTFDGGLNRFNPKTKQFKRFLHNENNNSTIAQNSVWTGVEDSRGRIWLGFKTEGLGVYHPKTGEFHNYKISNDNNLISNFIFSLFIDSKNRLFIGTSKGLNVINLDTLKEDIPKTIRFLEIDEIDIKGNRVNYITEDYLNNIWLGTENGIYKLDSGLNLLKTYTSQSGLPNNLVVGLVEDNNNNIWITTKSGMSFLNPKTHHFKNFNLIDGLQGAEYQSKSIAKTLDGRIIAGGLNGFNFFNPNDVVLDSTVVFKPHISNFGINNRRINSGDSINGRILLHKDISNTQDLTLQYNENNISFGFEAIYLNNPSQVKYIYKMHGVDEEFVNAGPNRSVNYSNLQPGNYVFEVKASLDDDWKQQNSALINIEILPPIWKTWWAYLGYVLIGFLLLWVILYFYTQKVKEGQEHELDLLKLQFFVNVSHEFRTPLTLILNPIDHILSNLENSKVVKDSALSIQRSARRLLYLVNQLLDYRKMDVGRSPLQLQEGNIIKYTKEIFLLFKDLASSKNIKYTFNSSTESLVAFFDYDKIEKILTNLISNALKFTGSGGEIEVSVNKVTEEESQEKGIFKLRRIPVDFIEIEVKDTGIGMKKEQVKKIFSRFYNVDANKTGTGIGLNFTKALVEIHKGEIYVESKFKKGSRFVVKLPLKQQGEVCEVEHVKDEFLINTIKSLEYDMYTTGEVVKEEESSSPKKLTILIVEDNKELRLHLKSHLKTWYKVKEAENGKDGLKMVNKYYPDIVISDIMMPKMDGFELCRILKSNIETSHIPVILLTARTLDEDKIEGFEIGADEYLPKPFSLKVLTARIKNLIELKKRLQEKFSKAGALLPSKDKTTNTLDEVFLEKVTNIVLENIENPDFSLEVIYNEVGLGSSHFFRKIQSITGQNPSGFIRTIRLNYASGLLMKGKYTIKEVAYKSGFNSPTYFGKAFKKQFKLTPKEFINKNLKN